LTTAKINSNVTELSQHEKEQLRQWQNASYAQRLAWLEAAQKLAVQSLIRTKSKL